MRKISFFGIIILFVVCFAAFAYADDTFDYAKLDVALLNQDPDPAQQGDYVEMRWKVIKTGNDLMKDIKFHLYVDYPFYFDGSDRAVKDVGNWIGYSDNDEFYTLYYKFLVDENAVEATYKVKLKAQYDNTNEITIGEYELRVGEDTAPDFVLGTLVTSPLRIYSDTEENSLSVTLENIGDEGADNVRMELILPDGFTATYGYSDRANLGTIAAGGSKTATYYLDLDEDVSVGEHMATINLSYKESEDKDNIYRSITLPLDIPVNGRPKFQVGRISISPDNLQEGTEAKLNIEVKNVGTKEAESVSLRALKESTQPFDFDEKSDFIGKLGPGETGEAVISFTVEEGAAVKDFLLDVEIRGIFNDNVITDTGVIPITVNEKVKESMFDNGSPVVGIVIIAIILAIGVIAYFTFMKKNQKKK